MRVMASALLLALVAALLGAARPASATTKVVDVVFFAWASEIFEDQGRVVTADLASDGGASKAIHANAALAVQHFNNRDANVLAPSLIDLLAPCDKTLELSLFCDSQGATSRVVADLIDIIADAGTEVDVVIGPPRSATASLASVVADATASIPVVSHWATSPRLANKANFPGLARTIPSDAAMANVLAEWFHSLNYTKVGMIFVNDAFGAGWKDSLFTSLESRDMELSFFPYEKGASTQDAQQRAMEIAVNRTASLELNVLVVIAFDVDFARFAQAADKAGLNDNDDLLIVVNGVDSAQQLEAKGGDDDTTAELLHGAFWITPTLPPGSRFADYVEYWRSDAFETNYLAGSNARHPPNGLANTDKCLNDQLDYQLPANFFKNTADSNFEVWAYVHDAIVAAGVAACHDNPTGNVPSGEQLWANLLEIEFEGLSGQVSFDAETGDRDHAGFALHNFVRVGEKNVTASEVAIWNATAGEWVMNASAVVFRRGAGLANVPPDVTPPVHNKNQVPLWAKGVGWAMLGLMNALILGTYAWMWNNRHHPVVVNSQAIVLYLMLLGLWIAAWTIVPLGADDSDGDPLDEDAACMFWPLTFSFGVELALAAIVGKLWRIWIIFRQRKIKRIKARASHLMMAIFAFMTCQVGVLVAFAAVAPLKWERIVLKTDVNGKPLESVGGCHGNDATGAFAAVLASTHTVTLLVVLYVAGAVRRAPADYQESRFLFVAGFSMFQAWALGAPAVAAVYNVPVARYILCVGVVTVTVLALWITMFVPKFLVLHFGPSILDGSNTYTRYSQRRSARPNRSSQPAGTIRQKLSGDASSPKSGRKTRKSMKTSGPSSPSGGDAAGSGGED